MYIISQIFSTVSTLFMIWMLVDCIRNQSLKKKGGWIFFILFTQFIGAAVYFFTRGPWPKVRRYLFEQNSFSNSQAPHTSQRVQETFSAYGQGYQAQEQAPTAAFQEQIPASEASLLQPEYEQPSVAYPEMPPPMEQRQSLNQW